MNLQVLGLKLLRYRDLLTQTVDEVAISTGIGAERLGLIETGQVEPSGDEILILADHYRCDFKLFISNDKVTPLIKPRRFTAHTNLSSPNRTEVRFRSFSTSAIPKRF
ncbi:helix-turn-helix domain-containing protein [Ralstonia solanacearum]|uniref:helix-turn-helix domain-containing protein n=1 Tax=Ralstonia solanacearum TaxID=305 RepID=UPI001FEFA7B3|nr:helix-turn-helix transcriptional regulator [Ralstonia solanacearum]